MRRSYGVVVIMFSFVLLTGCWNRREMNDLALVMAMSIDKAERGYEVSVQVVDPGEIASKQGSTLRSPVIVYSETGEHIFEAIRKMTKITPRKLYFSHLQMLVLGESLAKEGIAKPLDFFARDHEFREDFFVVVSKNRQGKDILETLTSLEKIPANKMYSSLQTSQRSWAPTYAVALDELINGIASDGQQPVLTGITVNGDLAKSSTRENVERSHPYARLQYEDIAVFKKDKLLGWLNERESKGFNYITNHVKSTVGPVDCPGGGKFGVEIIRSKSRMNGKVTEGKPSVTVSLNIEVNIGEVFCQADLTDPETIKKMEEETEKVNIEIMEAAVTKAKMLRSDIFGFGEVIHRTDPKAWKKLKSHWDEHFASMDVEIQSDVRIRRTGTVNRSFRYKEEEEAP